MDNRRKSTKGKGYKTRIYIDVLSDILKGMTDEQRIKMWESTKPTLIKDGKPLGKAIVLCDGFIQK